MRIAAALSMVVVLNGCAMSRPTPAPAAEKSVAPTPVSVSAVPAAPAPGPAPTAEPPPRRGGGPRVLLVVNVDAEGEVRLSGIERVLSLAGLREEAAFALSDLEVLASRGEYDIAVVDLSFPDATPRAEQAARSSPRPLWLVSLDFMRRPVATRPSWARQHVTYSSAQQLARELVEVSQQWAAAQP